MGEYYGDLPIIFVESDILKVRKRNQIIHVKGTNMKTFLISSHQSQTIVLV